MKRTGQAAPRGKMKRAFASATRRPKVLVNLPAGHAGDTGRFSKFRDILYAGTRNRMCDVDGLLIGKKKGAPIFHLIEAAACERTMPEDARPERYKHFWRFHALLAVVEALRLAGFEAHLWVLNYRDAEHNVRLAEVINVSPAGLEMGEPRVFSFANFKAHLLTFESRVYPITKVLAAVRQHGEKGEL